MKSIATLLLLSLIVVSCHHESTYKPKNEVKYYVINLDNKPLLLRKISERFQSAKLSFERIAAIWGMDLNREELTQKGLYAEIAQCPARLVPGELGCYLSHVKTLQKAYEDKAPYSIIMEEDAEFGPDLSQQVDELIEHAPPDWDMIYLYCGAEWPAAGNPCHPSRLEKTPDNRFTKLNGECVAGGVGYLVANHTLKSLLTGILPARMPVDFFYRERLKNKPDNPTPLVSYCANPQAISTRKNGSSIGPKRDTELWNAYFRSSHE